MGSYFQGRAVAAIFGLLALLGSRAETAAAAEDSWSLNVAPGECQLKRHYSLNPPMRLSIETDVGSDRYSLSIARKNIDAPSDGFESDVALRIDGRVEARDFVGVFETNAPYDRAANMASLSAKAIDAIGAGHDLAIRGKKLRIGPVTLPQAAEAIAALRRCEAEQLIEWGADASQFQPGGARPDVMDRDLLIPQQVLRRMRFPQQRGKISYALLLNEQGSVVRCSRHSGPGNPAFDRELCAQLQGRKIGTPARDPAGKPVRGVVTYIPGLMITVITSTRG